MPPAPHTPTRARAWIAAAIGIALVPALLTGCGSSSPAATTAAETRAASSPPAKAVRCADQSPSRETYVSFSNLLNVPVVLTNTLSGNDCDGWSGPSNPSALDGVTLMPNQSTGPRRFEVATSCVGSADSQWLMTFTLENGEEILSTRTKYDPCRGEYHWQYGFYYWQGGDWDRAVHTFTPASQGAKDALGNRQVALLGSTRSMSQGDPDTIYIMFDKP